MRPHDLLGNGQAQPRTAAVGRARSVQTVELLKDHAELGSGNRVALILKPHRHAATLLLGNNANGRALVAVRDGVLHYVVEHARHLVAIDEHDQAGRGLDLDVLALLGEGGIELVGDLRQQERQVDVAAREHDVVEVEAGDVEELLDERIQAMRLVQGDAGKTGALLGGKVGRLLQQRQVAHHTGERGLEVVGEVGDEVVLAAGLVAQGVGHLALAAAHAVDGALHLEERPVEVRHVLGMVDQALDHVGGDGAIRQRLAPVVPHVIHGAAGKEHAAHRQGEQEAAEHEQVVDVQVQRAHVHDEQAAEEQDEEPGQAAQRNDAACRDKAVDEHVAHHDHDEEHGQALVCHHRKGHEHERHDGEQAAVEHTA